MRTSASERSIRLPSPTSARSSTPPVAPLSPTFPLLMMERARVAVHSWLRSSCAKNPSFSFNASACLPAMRKSRW